MLTTHRLKHARQDGVRHQCGTAPHVRQCGGRHLRVEGTGWYPTTERLTVVSGDGQNAGVVSRLPAGQCCVCRAGMPTSPQHLSWCTKQSLSCPSACLTGSMPERCQILAMGRQMLGTSHQACRCRRKLPGSSLRTACQTHIHTSTKGCQATYRDVCPRTREARSAYSALALAELQPNSLVHSSQYDVASAEHDRRWQVLCGRPTQRAAEECLG